MKKIFLGLAAAAAIFAAVSCGGGSKKAKFHYLEKGSDNKVKMTIAEFEIKDGKLMKDGEQATAPALTDAAEFVLTSDLEVNGEDRKTGDKLIVDGMKWYDSEECKDTDNTFDAADPKKGDWYAKYKFDDGKVRVTFKMAKTDGTWTTIGTPVEVGTDKKVPAANIPAKTALTGTGVITDAAVALAAELKLGTGDTAVSLGLKDDKVKATLDSDKLIWTDATKTAVDLATKTFDASADVYVAYERTTFHVTFWLAKTDGTWFQVPGTPLIAKETGDKLTAAEVTALNGGIDAALGDGFVKKTATTTTADLKDFEDVTMYAAGSWKVSSTISWTDSAKVDLDLTEALTGDTDAFIKLEAGGGV